MKLQNKFSTLSAHSDLEEAVDTAICVIGILEEKLHSFVDAMELAKVQDTELAGLWGITSEAKERLLDSFNAAFDEWASLRRATSATDPGRSVEPQAPAKYL